MIVKLHLRWAWPALAGLVVGTAQAAGAAVPPVATACGSHHVSAFHGYRPYADEPLRPWAEVNEEVARAGGWRAYAREAGEPPRPEADAGRSSTSGCPPSQQVGQPGAGQ